MFEELYVDYQQQEAAAELIPAAERRAAWAFELRQAGVVPPGNLRWPAVKRRLGEALVRFGLWLGADSASAPTTGARA